MIGLLLYRQGLLKRGRLRDDSKNLTGDCRLGKQDREQILDIFREMEMDKNENKILFNK